MKIVIAEGGPAGNVGSMALIENAIKIVRQKHPGCEVTVMSSDPLSVIRALNKEGLFCEINVIEELFVKPKKGFVNHIFWAIVTISWFIYSRVLLLFWKKISWACCGVQRRVLREIEEAEYVYCIGAERINDVYFKTALLALYTLGTYIKMGKKLVHLSLTIGPVFNRSTTIVAKKIMNESYAIFVRDSKSYSILNEWDCASKYQFNSYDIALLQDIDESKARTLMNEFGIHENFIGASVISWGFRNASGPSRQQDYNEAYAEALDFVIEKYDCQVVFTPTVICDQYTTQDTDVAMDIIAMMKHKDKVISINRLLTPIELATIYSHCYFSIVTRMHAAILCSGAGGKPVISINYLYKLREYMKNIGFEDYSVDIDYVNSQALISFVNKMFEQYDMNIKKLNNRVGELREILRSDLMQI